MFEKWRLELGFSLLTGDMDSNYGIAQSRGVIFVVLKLLEKVSRDRNGRSLLSL